MHLHIHNPATHRSYGYACLLFLLVGVADFLDDSLWVLMENLPQLIGMIRAGQPLSAELAIVLDTVYHFVVPIGHLLLAATAWRGYRARSLRPLWEVACGVCAFHWLWLLQAHLASGVPTETAWAWYVDVVYAVVMVVFWLTYGFSESHPSLAHHRYPFELGAIAVKFSLLLFPAVYMLFTAAVDTAWWLELAAHLAMTATLSIALLLLGREHPQKEV